MTWEMFGQILLSLGVGGAIGVEREFRAGIGIGVHEVTLVAAALVMSSSGASPTHDSAQLALIEHPDVNEFHVVLLDELH